MKSKNMIKKDMQEERKQKEQQKINTAKPKLQDVSQENENQEETEDNDENEWTETAEEQLKKDSKEKDKTKSKTDRQKRYSYLERAFKNPPKKKVQSKDPFDSPDDSYKPPKKQEIQPPIENHEHHDKHKKHEDYKSAEHHNLSEETKEQLVDIIAGSLSGIISTLLSQPLDELKRRSQAYDNRKFSRGIWQEVRVLYAEKGLHSFWKGHIRAQILSVFHSITLFWTYGKVMTALDKIPAIEDYDLLQNFTAGFCSGATTTMVKYPIEQLRTRITALVRIKRRFHKIDIRPLLKFDLWHMFQRGIFPNILHTSFNYGLKFFFYNMLCQQVFAKNGHQERDDIPSERLLLAGATAGILAHSLTYPLDIVTRRLEVHALKRQGFTFDNNCRTLLQCIFLVMRTEGCFGMYKGMLPVIIKTTVNTSVMFTVFDKMHKAMEKEI